MESSLAFQRGELNRGKEEMVFDWDEAARIILETGAITASAGLRDDWEWTGGLIFEDGEPISYDYTYLASTWAIPELCINGNDPIPCYKMKGEVPQWDAKTKWPESALSILKAKAIEVFCDVDLDEVIKEATKNV